MGNLIEFGRMVLSYGVVMLTIVLLGAAALTIGIRMAKKKNAELEAAGAAEGSRQA